MHAANWDVSGSGCNISLKNKVKRLVTFLVDMTTHHSMCLPFREIAKTPIINNNVEVYFDVINIRVHPKTAAIDAYQLQMELKQLTDLHKYYQSNDAPAHLRGMIVTPIAILCAASNVTGVMSDVKRLTTIVHSNRGYACWDFAAVAGHAKIDMNPVDNVWAKIDVAFFSPHKLLGGPQTPGILIIKKQMLNNRVPAHVGGGTVFYVTDNTQTYIMNHEDREEAGTPEIIGSIRAGLVYHIHSMLIPKIPTNEYAMAEYVLREWSRNPMIEILGPLYFEDPTQGQRNFEECRVGIISFNVLYGTRNADVSEPLYLHYMFVVALLNDMFGIQSRGGCACAGPYAQFLQGLPGDVARDIEEVIITTGHESLRPGFVRAGVHFTMNWDEVELLTRAVVWVAEIGWQLLPYYAFSPDTGTFEHRFFSSKKNRSYLSELNFVKEPTGQRLRLQDCANIEMPVEEPKLMTKDPKKMFGAVALPGMGGLMRDELAKKLNQRKSDVKEKPKVLEKAHVPDASSAVSDELAEKFLLLKKPKKDIKPKKDPEPKKDIKKDPEPQKKPEPKKDPEPVNAAPSVPSAPKPTGAGLVMDSLRNKIEKRAADISAAKPAEDIVKEPIKVHTPPTSQGQGSEVVDIPDGSSERQDSADAETSRGDPPATPSGHPKTDRTLTATLPVSGTTKQTDQHTDHPMWPLVSNTPPESTDELFSEADQYAEYACKNAKRLENDMTERFNPDCGKFLWFAVPWDVLHSLKQDQTGSKRLIANPINVFLPSKAKGTPERVPHAPFSVWTFPYENTADIRSAGLDEMPLEKPALPLPTGDDAVSYSIRRRYDFMMLQDAADWQFVEQPTSAAAALIQDSPNAPGDHLENNTHEETTANDRRQLSTDKVSIDSGDEDVVLMDEASDKKPLAIPKDIRKMVGNAIRDFDMIKGGDQILVAVSGGKDSLTMLHVLREVLRRSPVKFSIAAATVDPQSDDYNPEPLKAYMESIGVKYHFLSQPIMELARQKQPKSIYAFCSRMREGMLYSCMRENGYNVLALGQHADDICETYKMSLSNDGSNGTMKANNVVRDGDLRVIRPLVLTREKVLGQFAADNRLPVIRDNCPACFRERRDGKVLQELENADTFETILKVAAPLMSVQSVNIHDGDE
eukprot:GHVO01017868.1.p1 GENE.GHVO01017868.1~~GHVO01017868.1.p1  ORF type:complete len:1257 (+),score=230.36 GHVO01017868.1:342-3773(+)